MSVYKGLVFVIAENKQRSVNSHRRNQRSVNKKGGQWPPFLNMYN